VSFWRYKLLEMIVALATFPLLALVGFVWFSLWMQLIDLKQNRWLFIAVAVPFLVGWLLLVNRLTHKAEQRWITRHAKEDTARCSPRS
jgi:membrane protein DedA with SNARE-associated domain